MGYTEAELEQAIANDMRLLEPYKLTLIGRQVPIECGVMDLLARRDDGGLHVIEIKKGRVGCSAVGQFARYMQSVEWHTGKFLDKAVDQYTNDIDETYDTLNALTDMYRPYEVTGTIVGLNIDADAYNLMAALKYRCLFQAIKLVETTAVVIDYKYPKYKSKSSFSAAKYLDDPVFLIKQALEQIRNQG